MNVLLDYAAGVERGSQPVRVSEDGGVWRLKNGTHRWLVAYIRGDETIEVEVVP